MSARLTHHATTRAHERLGLGAVSAERLAETALAHGLSAEDVAGQLRRWLLNMAGQHPGTRPLIYGAKVFIFGKGNAVITILNLPAEYQRAANRRAARKA